jgi:N utilization substance protein B
MTDENFSRTLSRLAAVQILYELDLKDELAHQEKNVEAVIKSIQKHHQDVQNQNTHTENLNLKFLKRLVVLTLQNLEKIDSIIVSHLKDDAKLATLLRATLRAGTCEALYFTTPAKVTIDEYVKITKKFFDEEEAGFVNALLDKVRKED